MSDASSAAKVLKRHCPVCGGDRGRLLFHQCFETIERASLMDGYDVVICADCGCAFADGIPSQAAFDAYYRDLSKYEYSHQGGQVSPYDMARFQASADAMQPFIPSRETRILDIGCATGAFLAVLKERGYGDVTGLDPSPACAAAADRLYSIRVLTGALSDASPQGEGFDFLVLIGVLEHIRDLQPMLERIRGLARPGGVVYVEVPDATRFLHHHNAPFQQFSVEHVNFFSPASLENLMRANGFSPVSVNRGERVVGYRTIDPVVAGVFRRQDGSDMQKDAESEPALREYIRQSQALADGQDRLLAELAEKGRPILVWGVGTSTQRLLATSPLARANIRAFVDSNPKYQGKTLHGLGILPPTALAGRPEPILIASWMHQEAILRQIRDDLMLANEVILLDQT